MYTVAIWPKPLVFAKEKPMRTLVLLVLFAILSVFPAMGDDPAYLLKEGDPNDYDPNWVDPNCAADPNCLFVELEFVGDISQGYYYAVSNIGYDPNYIEIDDYYVPSASRWQVDPLNGGNLANPPVGLIFAQSIPIWTWWMTNTSIVFEVHVLQAGVWTIWLDEATVSPGESRVLWCGDQEATEIDDFTDFLDSNDFWAF